jgi:peptidase M48-like protein
VAHVIARHRAERMSQVLLAQIALAAADVALAASNAQYRPAIGAAMGVGAVYGVLLPFSRTHESEADRIGLILMAKAGYDPAEAAETHPSHATRVAHIRQWLPEANRYYAQSTPRRTAELVDAVSGDAAVGATQGKPPTAGEESASISSASAVAAVQPARGRSAVQEQAWILGAWEAVAGKSGRVKGVGRFEFRRDGRQIKWTMARKGWFSGVETTQEASGTVTRISEALVELRGKYDSSNLGVVDQPVRHSLARDGDRLRGFEIAGDGTQSELSLEKRQ